MCERHLGLLHDLVVDLDDIVADDHLALVAAADHAHHAGRGLQSVAVHLRRIGNGEAQPRQAMLKVRDVAVAANQPKDVLCDSRIVLCHGSLLLKCIDTLQNDSLQFKMYIIIVCLSMHFGKFTSFSAE